MSARDEAAQRASMPLWEGGSDGNRLDNLIRAIHQAEQLQSTARSCLTLGWHPERLTTQQGQARQVDLSNLFSAASELWAMLVYAMEAAPQADTALLRRLAVEATLLARTAMKESIGEPVRAAIKEASQRMLEQGQELAAGLCWGR